MRKNLWFLLTIAFAAAALAASAALLVDYTRPSPVFCDGAGACARMKATALARPLGVPLPAIGLIGVLGIGLAALVPGRGGRLVQLVLAAAGGLVAVALFVVQGMLGALCPFCAVVDASAIALGALSVLRWRKGWDPPSGRLLSAVAVGALLLSIATPLAVGLRSRVLPQDLPPPIAEEMRRTGRGKVTIVDFVDFECPYCRRTHAALAPLLEQRRDEVRVVRKHVPLRMHPNAMDAAKAASCGEVLGEGDAMADALFAAPPKDLTPEGCARIAEALGLDLENFRACVDDPATTARIEEDKKAFYDSGGQGLPTLWIDATKLAGDQDRATLESALDDAIRAL